PLAKRRNDSGAQGVDSRLRAHLLTFHFPCLYSKSRAARRIGETPIQNSVSRTGADRWYFAAEMARELRQRLSGAARCTGKKRARGARRLAPGSLTAKTGSRSERECEPAEDDRNVHISPAHRIPPGRLPVARALCPPRWWARCCPRCALECADSAGG